MDKRKYIQLMTVVILITIIVGYINYIDVSDIGNLRKNYHSTMITVETFNNYLENKEIMGIEYDVETNFITGELTEAAVMKYGYKSDDNRKIMLDSVMERIESGEITNEAVIDKVDNMTESYKNSYKGTAMGVLLIGIALTMMVYIADKKSMNTDGETNNILKSRKSKKVEVEVQEVGGVKLDDIKGHDEVKEDIEFIIKMIKNPERYDKLGAKVPKGVLLFGPPGTGKTMIAKAIANEVGIPFYAAGGSDFMEKYVGVGAKRIRSLFKEAKKQEKAIIYIDEIDAVGKKRQDSDNEERASTLNALLMEMDGFEKSDNVLVIASTNRMDMLDDALLRPGRFDKHITVNNPDCKGRLEILELYAKDKKLCNEIDMEYIAKITRGFSGAELANLLNEAAMLTAFRELEETTIKEIDDAYYKIVTKGDKKKEFKRSLTDTEITAWHEAGHAIVSWLGVDQKVNKVTIVPSTSGAGGITIMEPKENDYYSKKDLENMVKICYGGRAAEYILLGNEDQVTTGASNDIEKATNIIISMLSAYGMSDRFGLINMSKIEGMNTDNLISEAREVSQRIYKETISFLEDHYVLLKELSEYLIDKETIGEKELNKMIIKYEKDKQRNVEVVNFEDKKSITDIIKDKVVSKV